VTLDEFRLNTPCRVVRLVGEPLLRERLTELGFTPGTIVAVSRRALLGDPLQVELRGGGFAVRRDEARCVEIEERVER
jgi:Fe2+ transport system protein FeoA